MTRPMAFAELHFACAELRARAAMTAEAAQAAADAATVRALLRRRVTQRLHYFTTDERAVWSRHVELQRSLRALRRELQR